MSKTQGPPKIEIERTKYSDQVYLKIIHYDVSVKDVIKNNKGQRGYNPDKKMWLFSIDHIESLESDLKRLSAENSIEIIFDMPEWLEELKRKSAAEKQAHEEKKKLEEPSFYDYNSNPEFYNSINDPQEEIKKQTAPQQVIHPGISAPILSTTKCAFRHLCNGCEERCVNFLSVADAWGKHKENELLSYANIDYKPEEFVIPNKIYIGKNKYAEAKGHFSFDRRLFVVGAGSRMAFEPTSKLSDKSNDLRYMLRKKGFVNDRDIFVENYTFSSVGEATEVITGSTPDWRSFWKMEEKKIIGNFSEIYSPTMVSAIIENCEIVGILELIKKSRNYSDDLQLRILEGCVIPEINVKTLSASQKKIYFDLSDSLDIDRRLKVDFVFPSSAIAAAVLTSGKVQNTSLWKISKDTTVQDVLNLHTKKNCNGIPVYHCEIGTNGAFAAGYEKDGKFVVMKGSLCAPRLRKSCSASFVDPYKKLHQTGKIVNNAFVDDVVFSSSSSAASVCCGTSMNGRKESITPPKHPSGCYRRGLKPVPGG